MFFSKALLLAISLGALSVLATPHALHHHALHRRAVAARVASDHTNATVPVKRQNSPKCRPPASSNIPVPSSIPVVSVPSPIIPPVATTPNNSPPPSPTTQDPSPDRQQHPTTTSTPSKPATSAPAPAPAPTSPGTGGGPFSGQGTWFATGLGACGITNTASQFIVAVSEIRFDSFPGYNGQDSNDNPICGKQVVITSGGHTATATVTDRCVACADGDLDMTTSLFQQFADLGVGRIEISWNFA